MEEGVHIKVDIFADIQAGAVFGLAAVSASDIAAGTGVFFPTNPSSCKNWCVCG